MLGWCECLGVGSGGAGVVVRGMGRGVGEFGVGGGCWVFIAVEDRGWAHEDGGALGFCWLYCFCCRCWDGKVASGYRLRVGKAATGD